MRILVISRSPWRLDNSFGNTYSSIFRGMKDVEIANIYLSDGTPEYEENVKAYYQISEKELVTSFRHFNNKMVGKRITISEKSNSHESMTNPVYLNIGKKQRWPIMFIVRELLWKYGNINIKDMDNFVKSFKPDIIFLPYYYAVYVYRLALHIQRKFNLPMTGEAALDIYSMKQLSFDPLFWVNRLWIRNWIRKASSRSTKLYMISEKMRRDYEEYLNIPCKILYKIPDFSRTAPSYCKTNKPVRFLFTGNIGSNRWKTLALLANMLKKKNYGYLDIYTASPITNTMRKALCLEGYSNIHAPVSQDQVKELQKNADVLVHAESFDLSNRLLVRYSISTKIMDYLCVGRTILAIGPNDIASIEYLKDNNAALIATNKQEIDNIISSLKQHSSKLIEYSKRGLYFAKTQMNDIEMKAALWADLQEIINNYQKNIEIDE